MTSSRPTLLQLRGGARPGRLHKESLLRLPLVRTALFDPRITLRKRAVDQRWVYEKALPVSMVGFNPFAGGINYAARSRIADWMKNPTGSARDHNERDQLMFEVLFAMHDYLHAWSYALIRGLMPSLGMGTAPIGPDNIEALVFGHMVSEAVATIGLDYWYMSTIDLQEICPIGTEHTTLTVDYHDDLLPEIRRFCPGFNPQKPQFFVQLAQYYCTGVFHGFDIDALRRSPILLTWLEHELRYGFLQRPFIREWLSFLSGGAVRYKPAQLAAPVACDAPWQQRLMREAGQALWDKIKHGKETAPLHFITPQEAWHSPRHGMRDYRFVNLLAAGEAELAGASTMEPHVFTNFFCQLISSLDFAAFDKEKVRLFPMLRQSHNPRLLLDVFKHDARLSERDEAPVDLLLLN